MKQCRLGRVSEDGEGPAGSEKPGSNPFSAVIPKTCRLRRASEGEIHCEMSLITHTPWRAAAEVALEA